MSHRTLNRRLLHAGLNVRDIFGSVRFEVSRQLLRDTSLSIGDIAGALGYSETSPFVRAFRRWSGTTPQSWREQVAAGQAAIVVTRDGSAGPSPRAEDASRRVGGETRQAEAA
jgi:AraC-like DNA-binding protein